MGRRPTPPRSTRPSRRRRGERGIALLIVLWMLTVVSILAAGFAKSTRTETQVVFNSVEAAKARALIGAGVELAVLGLLNADEEARWKPDGTLYETTFDGGTLEVRISDEKGKIDLNSADDALIKGLLDAAGLDLDAADRLGDAILDWRDVDDLRRLNGAEDADYKAAGLDSEAGDGPFVTVSQLRQVLGMTAEIYAGLAPNVTVHSLAPTVNPVTASATVLAALPGVVDEDVAAVLELRAEKPYTNGQEVAARLSAAGEWIQTAQGPVYALAVVSRTERGVRAAAEVVIWLAADDAQPYRVLDWRDYTPDSPDSSGSDEAAPDG